MTREQLNNYIDTNITNKTIPNTLTPTNEGNALKEVADYVDQEIATIPAGPTGAQGVQGPAGPIGPVGPAGLNWQGEWDPLGSYVEDDAVGYNGASWFCIQNVSASASPPDEDVSNWALLASQGAQGPQGVQGPAGAQGPAGISVSKVLKTTITSAQILSLFDNPITILDSSDPATIKLPINIWCQRQPGDAYVLASPSFQVINDLGTALGGNLNPNPLIGTSIGFITSTLSVVQNSSGVDRNLLYKLKAVSGNPTSGTGNLDVYVTYIEITL